jgi:hypothetical protein
MVWRRSKAPEAASTKLWRRLEAVEEVEGALEEVEDSGGSQHEALETTGSSAGSSARSRRL